MDLAPGDTMQAGDITLYAAKSNGTCRGCAFQNAPVGDRTCGSVTCLKIIWLTQQNYIIHRLTS